jgi:hypothetical protein
MRARERERPPGGTEGLNEGVAMELVWIDHEEARAWGLLSPDEIYRARVAEHVRRTREAQGLPPKITDAAALERVAEVVLRAEDRAS